MADAIIVATLKVVLEKVISLATDRIGLVFGFKKDLASLRESSTLILAVLTDAEDKQTKSRTVQLWLEKVRRVAFDAAHVLDELNYEILRRQVKSRDQPKGKEFLFFSFSKDYFCFHLRMASKVRDVNAKLKNFNLEATGIGLIRTAVSLLPSITSTTGVTRSRQTNSLVPQNVVGRARDESKIVEILLSSTDQIVSVIAIVGMGGLGKTTLAKSVYNNKRFSKKIWICVSERFEMMELFRVILESLRGGKVELSSQDVIVQEIRKELQGKMYLLVLDDVWNEISELWDDFFVSLVGLSTTSGNCCLLTTRLQKTASIVSTHDPYFLKELSDDDCWHILTQKVTKDGEIPEELYVLRKEILRRCHGLPLAANIIGGLLRSQKKEDWLSIVESKILKFSGDHEDSIMQILKLSFDYLPSPSIKKCFAYCSIFAKDTRLEGDQLIELWMAEGFLQSNVGRETMMEEIGGNYLRILSRSSLLEEVNDKLSGQYYEMHDLVHDLANLVSKTQRSHIQTRVMENNYQVRYLALDSLEGRTEMILNETSSLVRTLFVNSSISDEMFLKFKYLHVLNLSGVEVIRELPSSVSKLKHLRYLDLSRSKIKTLPESLCKLYNLQTLKLVWCFDLQGLPQGMNNLISLRHLHYVNIDKNFQMPPEMGRLTCLQTLEFFNVGEKKGCQIEELGCMEELKGKLEKRNLELVKGKEEAGLANLTSKI